MRYMILILALVAGSALANDCHMRSARISNELITVGDSARSAHELGPDREVQLENRYGGAAGYRLDFYLRGKTVEIHIRGGKVSKICQRRD